MHREEGDRLVFEYITSVLMRSFLESGINMMDIAMTQGGAPDIESYVEHFPFIDNERGLYTEEMSRRLFTSPTRGIDNIARMLVVRDYDRLSATDINGDRIAFPIRIDDYNPSDVQVFDNSIYDALVYGALAEWFANSAVPSLIEQAARKRDEAMAHLAFCAKKLECVLLRQQCVSPVFDDMLNTE